MPADTTSVWRKDILGWSLYDFANTIYSMNIVSLYLKRYIVEDLGYDDRYYDIPFAMSMVLAAILLPGLGALSDHSTKKKLFLFLFTLTCCAATGLLALVPSSAVLGTIILFVIANFAYEGGMPFYNALLYSVTDGPQARVVSGIGVAFGYVGSIVGMLLVQPFVTGSVLNFELSFVDGWGKTGAFLPTAVLFFVLALPLFFLVREAPIQKARRISFKESYLEVWEGVRETRKYPGVLRFLIADFCIEDAVQTVILNIGIYCSLVLAFQEAEINTFLVVSTTSAVIGSYLIGRLAGRVRLKRLMYAIVVGWLIALVLFIQFDQPTLIWILGSVVGILMGGLWTVSRPLLAELVPRDELGRFFGIFALSGRAAAIVGPLLWTTVVYFSRPDRYVGRNMVELFGLSDADAVKLPYKLGLASLAVMIFVGLIILRKVPDPATDEEAHG